MVDGALADMNFLLRVQDSFNPEDMTQDNLEDFLFHGTRTSGKEIKGRNADGDIVYRKDKRLKGTSGKNNLATILSNTKEVNDAIKRFEIDPESPATSIEELEEIKIEAEGLPVHSKTVSKLVGPKIKEAEEIEKQLIKIQQQAEEFAQEVDRIETLDIDKQKELFKSGTVEERRLAAVALKEESPQVLGGLISGERRAVGRAIRQVFG